jgi:hypothetical protein
MHGEDECAANLLQLCVAHHSPPEKNYEWVMRFMLCSWDNGTPAHSKETLAACMDKAGVSGPPRAAIEACVEGEEGRALMVQSAKVVVERKVQRSCTVVIEGKKRCIRDGGRWYDCPGGSEEAEFMASICSAYKTKTGREPPVDVCGPAAAAPAKGA